MNGPRQLDGAMCHIMPVSHLPAHLARSLRMVVGVFVPEHKRGEGLATALMREVCVEADREGISLILEPKQSSATGLTDGQLEGWYERLGFQRFQDHPVVLMVRTSAKPN